MRPLAGWAGLLGSRLRGWERRVVAGYGIRGIGSLYYLAYALGQQDFFVPQRELWAVVTFTVLVSVVLHGVTAGPVVARLDRWRAGGPEEGAESGESGEPGEKRGAGTLRATSGPPA